MAKVAEYRTMPPAFKDGGLVRLVALAEGYAMVRRPGCIPFVLSQRQWDCLSFIASSTGEAR